MREKSEERARETDDASARRGRRKGTEREISSFSRCALRDILVASSRRISILISEILNAPIPPRQGETSPLCPSLSNSFSHGITKFHVARVCAYVFDSGQSRRTIVRRCIILLGAKGDDFITDPGNHSPKLALFSVGTVLVLTCVSPLFLSLFLVLSARFYPPRFHGERETERRGGEGDRRRCRRNV